MAGDKMAYVVFYMMRESALVNGYAYFSWATRLAVWHTHTLLARTTQPMSNPHIGMCSSLTKTAHVQE